MGQHTHMVLLRPLGKPWEKLAYAKSLDSAIANASKRRKGLKHGDLLLAIDMAHVSDIVERSRHLLFVDSHRKTRYAGAHQSTSISSDYTTWLSVWEGPEAIATMMLSIAKHSGREFVMPALCAIVRTALPYVPVGEHRPRIAVETAEAWARGEATLADVAAAGDDAETLYRSGGGFAARSASMAAICAGYNTGSFPVGQVARDAARALVDAGVKMDIIETLKEYAGIVRECIPLHVLLESHLCVK